MRSFFWITGDSNCTVSSALKRGAIAAPREMSLIPATPLAFGPKCQLLGPMVSCQGRRHLPVEAALSLPLFPSFLLLKARLQGYRASKTLPAGGGC